MKTTIVKDESFIAGRAGKRLPDGEYPFYRGDQQRMVHCIHSADFTGLTDKQGDKHYGVIAMALGEAGLFATFTPSELRAMATRMNSMADHIESSK